MSVLAGIVAFEWRFATRGLVFAAASLLLAGMGFALGATGFGPPDGHVNGPYPVALSAGLLSLTAVLAATVICGPALLRDTEQQMAELVYATAVTRWQYFGGRFTGSFLVLCTAYALGMAGLALGAVFGGHDAERLAPFSVAPYVRAFLLLGVPGLLTLAAVIVSAAALTRSTAATYVVGVGVYVLYFVSALFSDSPLMAGAVPQTERGMAISALADPFGLSALFAQTRHWTATERDARPIALGGHMLSNRLLWSALTCALLALSYRRFAFRVVPRSRRPALASEPAPGTAPKYRAVRAAAEGTSWAALRSALRLEVRWLLRGWTFLALLVLWVGTAGIEMVQTFRSNEFGTALWPTTGLLVNGMAQSLALFGLLAVVYHAAEVVWRERSTRIAEVIDATPVSSAVFVAAKIGALAAMLAVLAATGIATAVVFQLACGHRPDNLLVYTGLLYFTGLPLVLFGVLAVAVQTLSPNRHVGLLATLAAGLFLHRGALGGPEHPLLRYAIPLPVEYSAMAGFSPAAASFTWFQAYWSTIAALLALATCALWRRGTDTGLRSRLAAMPRRLPKAGRRAALAGSAVVLLLGAAIGWQTNFVNRYETLDSQLAWNADYERKYGHLREVAQPRIVHLSMQADLHPAQRRCRIHGRLRLENPTAQPIPTVWVVTRRDLAAASLALAGRPPSRVDSRFGVQVFELEAPLAPAASVELAFDVLLERRGASAEADLDILPNGTFLLGTAMLPSVGYRRGYELTDPRQRRSQGLPARDRQAESAAEELSGAADQEASATFDLGVSTEAGQTAIAPGVLEASWESEGRSHTRFTSRIPVVPNFAVASARYATRSLVRGGMEVVLYYHAEHSVNADALLEAATRSVELFTARFGPYPFPQLRIAEVPSYALPAAAFALPGVVYYAEQRGFLTDRRDPSRVDLLAKRVAHEVAHQWWGHQVMPAIGPGSLTLVETLARDSELQLLELLHGEEASLPVLEVELQRYLSGRAGAAEVPLAEVESQSWLYYSKGALVMTAMRDLAGDAAIDAALRELVAQAPQRQPAAADLVEGLRRAVPEPHRGLVDDWWRKVVLYDLRVEAATAQRLPDGRFRVDARVGAGRVQVRDGRDAPLDLDEDIEIAVYAEPEAGSTAPGRVLLRVRQRLTGPADVSFVVDEAPAELAIDPFLRRIDRDRADNVCSVTRVR